MKEAAQISNPEYSVDRIVARMKEAAARQGQLPEAASIDVVASADLRPTRRGSNLLSDLDLQPIQLQPRFQPSSESRYHVNDLLKFHDSSFVQNAYRAILKRGPDATGYRSFLDGLRAARLNKIDVLARLRYSAEGRAKQVEVEGLWLPATIRKAYRIPFIGYLLNLMIALVRLPNLIRSQQQFEAHTLAQQEMIVEHLNHADRATLAHVDEVSRLLQTHQETSKNLADQIEQSRNQLIDRLHIFDESIAHANRQNDLIRQQQSALQEQLLSGLDKLTDLVDSTSREWKRELNARLDQERTDRAQTLETVKNQLNENLAAIETRRKQLEFVFRLKETELQQAASIQREQLEVQHDQIEAQREQLQAQRTQIELMADKVKNELMRVVEKHQQVNTELVLQGERLTTVLAEARKRLPVPFDEDQLRKLAAEGSHTLDAFFASFDEQFRGSREEIKERLKIYLPIIRENKIGSEEMPILDVGSGRGEWLELLKQEGFQARGVDSNRILVEGCLSRDLDVINTDLIGYMQQLPESSLGAVTGFHIIEHLEIENLVEFLNQTVRVLKTGGAVIFETPNPQNVLVGSCNFYFDPTHRNPLPSQVTRFLLESRGFNRVEVLNLNPSDDTPVDDDTELARRFNKYFYGPMDYAVVGFRS